MSMIERVAKAIWGESPLLETQPEDVKEGIRKEARAAINALRNPSDTVLSAGWPYSPNINEAWEAMIDAALKESPNG